jgi:transposase
MKERRKVYDREFKINAVRMVQSGERTMKEIAADLDVNYYTLAEWKKQYETKGEYAFPGLGKVVFATEAEREIAKLKKALRRAEMERDLLKKAMAISLREK